MRFSFHREIGMLAKCAVAILCMTLPDAMLLGSPIPSEVPRSWNIEIETTAFYMRDRILVSITAFQQHDHELVVRYRRNSAEKGEVILVDSIPQSKARKYWDAFVAMQSRFTFPSKESHRMDGGFLRIELSIGTEALGMRYSRFRSLEDIAPELVAPLTEIQKLVADKVLKDK